MKHQIKAALWTLSALLPAQAWAQDGAGGSITVYGFLKANVETVRAGAGPSQARLSNDLSVLGLRGVEELGDGMQAFFQVEMPVAVDTGGGGDFSRNTGVGLRGRYGELLLGIWESPYRHVSVYTVDPFTAGIFASNAIMGNGFATAANAVAPASFDRRQRNLLHYTAPRIGPWRWMAAISAREERAGGADPQMQAALLSYDDGATFAAYGYERHRDYFAAGTRDSGHKIGAAHTLGAWRLRGAYERLRYQPTPATSLRRDAWQLAATWTHGAHLLRGSVTVAGNTRGNAATGVGGAGKPGPQSGARQWSVGYGYTLSKRSELWLAWTRTANGRNAVYNLSANPAPGLTAGQDVAGAGLGISHRF